MLIAIGSAANGNHDRPLFMALAHDPSGHPDGGEPTHLIQSAARGIADNSF
jgi:hypothetical protein